MARMESELRAVRFPKDFDAALKALCDEQGKGISNIVRGSLLLTWADHFAGKLGAERYLELVKMYSTREEGE